jgi:hypothetical protein
MFEKLKNLFKPIKKNSDGYHTFEELYQHRDVLFLNLCLAHKKKAWWSRRHSDGKEAFGYPWVVVGIGDKPGKQITYHINTEKFLFWSNYSNKIKELDYAPLWDRHSSDDVLFRLKTLDFN